jgi:hypothetical protein
MDLQMFNAHKRCILLNTPLSLLFQVDGFDLHKKKAVSFVLMAHWFVIRLCLL